MASKHKEDVVPLHVFQGNKFDQLKQLYDQWFACRRCDLSATREHDDIVFADGNPNAQVMIIGEAPGEHEDRTLTPFVGESGRLLNEFIALSSDDPGIRSLATWYFSKRTGKEDENHFQDKMMEYRHESFFTTNLVACRPTENATPIPAFTSACWERVWNLIYIVDPILIIAVGKTALEKLVRKQIEITKARGSLYDCEFQGRVRRTKYPVMATLHPSFLLRKADWKQTRGDYAQTVEDWKTAMRTLDQLRNKHYGTPFPVRGLDP